MSLAYRDSKCTNLSVSCPYQLIVYFVLKHIVVDRDCIYICSSMFSYLWSLFYCAQDIDA